MKLTPKKLFFKENNDCGKKESLNNSLRKFSPITKITKEKSKSPLIYNRSYLQ
jgi:hypothetical protein